MSIKQGIGYSSLTDKIFIGKQNNKKGMWVGDKEDITNDFLNVCFQYFEEGTVRTVVSPDSNKENFFLNIKKDKEALEKLAKFAQKEIDKLDGKPWE
jgi:NADPH:quinone reductase-like Zn-dependent oxidoreductase